VEVKVSQTKVQRRKLPAMQLMLRITAIARQYLTAAAAKRTSRNSSSSSRGDEAGQLLLLLLLLLGQVDMRQ
jgi:hypothetical protein